MRLTMKLPLSDISDHDISAVRPARNALSIDRPYEFLVEPECGVDGTVEDVATIFLTNRECPYRCLMCDLWRNTTVESVPVGAIPRQIDYALERLPTAQHVKLYNSGELLRFKGDSESGLAGDRGPRSKLQVGDRGESSEALRRWLLRVS